MAATRQTSQPADETFACPQCQARYRWKPELAGRRIRCKHCSSTFAPELAGEDDHATAVAAAAARSGFALPARSRTVATEQDELTAFHHWLVPLAVLAVGVALRLTQAIGHARRFDSVSIAESLGIVLLEWVIISLALAVAVVVCAFFVEMELEKIPAAVLKVAATAVLMCGVAQFCASLDRTSWDMWGISLGAPCVLMLAFLMLSAMFGADLLEALIGSVGVMVIVVAVMLGLAVVFDGEVGRVLALGRPG